MMENQEHSAIWQSICDAIDREKEEHYKRIRSAESAEMYLNIIQDARQQVLEVMDLIETETHNPDWSKIQETPIGKVFIKLIHLENSLCW